MHCLHVTWPLPQRKSSLVAASQHPQSRDSGQLACTPCPCLQPSRSPQTALSSCGRGLPPGAGVANKAGRLLLCKSRMTSSSTWSMQCRYLGSTPGVRPTEPGSSTPPATPAPPVSTVEPTTEPPVPPPATSAPETSETPVPPATTAAPETSATPESSPPPASPAPETPAPPASPPPSTGWCFRWRCGT